MVGCLALLSFAHGQGEINFRNTAGTLISTNSAPGGLATGPISGPSGSAYFFGLFVAPAGTSDREAFAFTGAYASNTGTAGRLIGGIPAISTYPPGSTVSLLVRGWSANIATTDYAAVINYLANPTFVGWYGESQIGTLFLGGGAFPALILFGPDTGQIPGFTLEMFPVPEPTSVVIVTLGLAALPLLRRRSH